MTFVPLISDGYTFPSQLVASVISTVIQAVTVIPLILFNYIKPNYTITAAIKEKNSILGFIAIVVYLLLFLTYAINGVIHFMQFLNARFFAETSPVIMMFILLVVCVYCAYCGIEGLSRSSVIIFVSFIVMLAAMAVTSSSNFETANFYSNGYENGLVKAVMEDLARNSEIIAAAFLIKNIKSCCKCSLYGLLAAKLIISEIITVLIIGVLGDYTKVTDYPFMSVGAYSGTELFKRNDSIYLILWTITAVISISLFINIAAGLSKELVPNLKLSHSIVTVIIFAVAAIFISTGLSFVIVRNYVCGAISTVILAGIVPLIMYLCTKGKSKNEIKNK